MTEEDEWLSREENTGQDVKQPATVSVEEMQVALANLSYEFDIRKFAFQGALTIAPNNALVGSIIIISKAIEEYLKEG